jgi:hypothetical protein
MNKEILRPIQKKNKMQKKVRTRLITEEYNMVEKEVKI